jgi:glycerophosphoryl diester phosphodiesterase
MRMHHMFKTMLLGGVLIMTADCSVEKEEAAHVTQVIAHRGASAYAPENTIAAFRLAAEMKAPWFELDCTLSEDGDVVVIHDDTLNRTTPLKGKVMETPTEVMTQADAGTWFDVKFKDETIPLLSETLDFAKGTIGVYIEIKDSDDDRQLKDELLTSKAGDTPFDKEELDRVLALTDHYGSRNLELTRKVIELVRERKMEKEIVIQSFSPIVCAVALIEAPELRTELLASSDRNDPEVWINFQRWAQLLNVPGFNINKKLATPEFVETMHAQGRTVAVWTVNDESEMKKFQEMNVDFIITDKPDSALNALK